MTVQDAIDKLEQRKDKTAHIYMGLWEIEDIESQIPEGQTLTEEEKIRVIGFMEKYHDANCGINWDSISSAIDIVMGERTE